MKKLPNKPVELTAKTLAHFARSSPPAFGISAIEREGTCSSRAGHTRWNGTK